MLVPPTTPTASGSPETALLVTDRCAPLALNQLLDDVLYNIISTLIDVDGTLTTKNKLPACTYSALERLHCAGIKVVPATGRSIT